jgi:hypothetical protein
MDFCPNQDIINKNPTAHERVGNIISFLGEAENIYLGLKRLETIDDDRILTVPLRFSQPILEPLDSSLEPTPLRNSGGLLNLAQKTPAVVSATVFPKWMPIANVSPSHHSQRLDDPTEMRLATRRNQI